MDDPATRVIVDRRQPGDGMSRTLMLSMMAHGLALAMIVLAPASWRSSSNQPDLRNVMTISLGGAPGPRAGGMTPLGGRPIQQVAETPTARPTAVRPPAAKAPEMAMPAPKAKATPKAAVKSAPEQSRGRTPTKGAEVRAGSAIAETGATGIGLGLSTGGGSTGGAIDVGDFCCPEYVATMVQLIQRNWDSKQQVVGQSQVKFTIQRDGRLTDVTLTKSSGYAALDLTAQRALILTRQIPPLPGQFTESALTVHLTFDYQR